ncbi:hypothetical protein Pmani_031493 [Petrolisthes manimaculis]|uniref:Uncharacterized protein n=1 Tax=Petrolisthes manimaculis TaxID=1843537 RepID=A0AAE1TRX7_9EUCA|nr:hypothetical protein Pmani_031493 [Petrolisthes manimaculis]
MDSVQKKIPPFSVLLVMLVMVVTGEQSSRIEKRQIFREAVLPSRGGVIPEGAFTRQRLQHNINDQLGVQAPDGHIFISRDFDNRFGVLDPEDDREILRLRPYDLNTITHVNGLVHHSKPLVRIHTVLWPQPNHIYF